MNGEQSDARLEKLSEAQLRGRANYLSTLADDFEQKEMPVTARDFRKLAACYQGAAEAKYPRESAKGASQ